MDKKIDLIPKYIHYCWYGGSKLPHTVETCIASWRRFMPDHELILWNEQNSPMNIDYMKNAYDMNKWSNLSNYTRLHALNKMGGWYFDTDIELLKTPDLSKFRETCFLALETKPWEYPYYVNNAVIGSIPNHPFINQCLAVITEKFDGTEEANLSSPHLTTVELDKIGFTGKPGTIENIKIFSHDFFYPSSWYEVFDKSMVNQNTICVHHNHGSWIDLNAFTKIELLNLLKENFKIKNEYYKFKDGKVSLKEYIKFNLNFLFRFFRVFKQIQNAMSNFVK